MGKPLNILLGLSGDDVDELSAGAVLAAGVTGGTTETSELIGVTGAMGGTETSAVIGVNCSELTDVSAGSAVIGVTEPSGVPGAFEVSVVIGVSESSGVTKAAGDVSGVTGTVGTIGEMGATEAAGGVIGVTDEIGMTGAAFVSETVVVFELSVEVAN